MALRGVRIDRSEASSVLRATARPMLPILPAALHWARPADTGSPLRCLRKACASCKESRGALFAVLELGVRRATQSTIGHAQLDAPGTSRARPPVRASVREWSGRALRADPTC